MRKKEMIRSVWLFAIKLTRLYMILGIWVFSYDAQGQQERPYLYACTFKNKASGEVHTMGGRTLSEARNDAEGRCNYYADVIDGIWSVVMRGEINPCVFVSCREPVSCPPYEIPPGDYRAAVNDKLERERERVIWKRNSLQCQKDVIEGKKSVAINRLVEAIGQKVRNDPAKANNALALAKAEELRLFLAAFQKRAEELKREFLEVRNRFESDKTFYARHAEKIASIAKEGNTTDLVRLSNLQFELEDLRKELGDRESYFRIIADVSQKQISSACEELDSKIHSYENLFDERKVAMSLPEGLCSRAPETIEKMKTHSTSQCNASQGDIDNITEILSARWTSLIHKKARKETLESLAPVIWQRSSNAFFGEVNTLVKSALNERVEPKTMLRYFSHNLRIYAQLENLRDMCNGMTKETDWMAQGCAQVRKRANGGKNLKEYAIPNYIKSAAANVFSRVVPEKTAIIESMVAAIDEGRIDEAIRLYELVLVGIEGGQQ